jgi:hypothetical protein
MGIPRRAFHFVAQAELLLINRGLAKLAAFLHTAATVHGGRTAAVRKEKH